MMRLHLLAWAALSVFTAASLPAQGRDPMHEIQEIARSVDEQLQEIDRLLLESGKQSQARTRPKELLEQASEHSATVETGIEKLIEKLTEMKNQGGEGSSDGEPQPQQGQGQQPKPQGQPQNRRENQTPDFVQQPKPEGQEPKPGQEKPGEGQPQGGEQSQADPQNRRGNRPPESETGPAQAGEGDGTWGELQPYVNFLKNRGSAPKVPEKYRKYWEAYLKNKQGGGR